MDEILVEEYRGDALECVHRGQICVVAGSKDIKYAVGDSDTYVFLRSSAKPIQAIPFFKHGIDEKLNFTEKETSIIMGSHRAEPFHVEALESILDKSGLNENQLVCLPTYPLSASATEEIVFNHGKKRSIYHNCSGKHLGVLSACKVLGYPTEGYFEVSHPIQTEILETLSYLSEVPKDQIKLGTDGCGFPVFALPLRNLAVVYLKLACPELIEDQSVRAAVEKIVRLMNENYEMVAGTSRICSLLLQDSNIVAKGGAKGVYCFGLKNEWLGVSIKITDGSEDEWPIIAASILEQIDYSKTDTIQRLYELYPVTIKNDNQRIVGQNKTVFTLK